MTLYTLVATPIGELLLSGDEHALHRLWMQDGARPREPGRDWRRADAPFAAARDQLEQYFAGERTVFDLSLVLGGTPFQQAVWAALREIPHGETTSYGALARRLGAPDAARAVGLANGRNPISVIVPCHRVIGANGSLTGFGGGLERKRLLLELESPARPLIAQPA
ncbi:MAG: methylated-DNA--[protein]-cysteine S-methyltransferase [Solirubrobacteraceae bacterium]